ncbi:hypothetical protein [Stutzerimonas stutzeri]|uniref:hypothetical protein n=1 Tax=Stutzerimonas stutzeri TaxID=316 RepID=UPI0012D3D3FA|nr:hypothetical protein [Stutzerimonas stutzeri]
MSFNKEEFYQRLLKKKQRSPSKAPVAPVKPDRSIDVQNPPVKEAIAGVPEEPSEVLAAEQADKPQYSEETKQLGRELAAWIRECRRR